MLTDRPPRKPSFLTAFAESDLRRTLDLPASNVLQATAKPIEASLESSTSKAVRQACEDFLTTTAAFYRVQTPGIRILAARPLRTREGGWASELFGDYDPETHVIRVWMKTAVRKQVTSFGTFLSTLCHEFSHHLDYHKFKYPDTWHTRGFYDRAAALYHCARGTQTKRLFWIKTSGGRWRIDWPRTNRGY
jgi:hypothetical protein